MQSFDVNHDLTQKQYSAKLGILAISNLRPTHKSINFNVIIHINNNINKYVPLAERGGGGYNLSIMIKSIDQGHDLSNNTKIYIQIYYGKIVIYKYLIN